LQAARKPDSVLDDHSSRRRVTAALQQPTRRFRLRRSPGKPNKLRSLRLGASGRYARAPWRVRARSLPIWSCSVWGLPCGLTYARPGALLPHLFTLTASLARCGGIFSVALAVQPPSSDRPGRYPAHCPAESGLSSPSRQRSCGRQRSSSRLRFQCTVCARQFICQSVLPQPARIQMPATSGLRYNLRAVLEG
jgi:hypothetical protein